MKLLISFALALLTSSTTFAQTKKVDLYGNFVFEKTVFRYHYTKNVGIHSLQLSTLAKTDAISDLDTTILSRTIASFDSWMDTLKKNELSPTKLDSLKKAKTALLALQQMKKNRLLVKDNLKLLDSLQSLISILTVDSLTQARINSKEIYSFIDALAKYQSVLHDDGLPVQANEVPFEELTQEVFRPIFSEQLASIMQQTNDKNDAKKLEAINKKADEILFAIKARAEFEDDEPITAYLNLKKSSAVIEIPINHYSDSVKTSVRSLVIFKTKKMLPRQIMLKVPMVVHNISVEFEDGTIKHVFADFIPEVDAYKKVYGNTPVRFRNLIPISVAGKFDPDDFANQAIFVGNSRELMGTLYSLAKQQFPSARIDKADFEKSNNQISFRLSEFLDYIVVPENNNEDYSPSNSIVSLSPNKTTTELKKEKRSKILDARIFTDFVGLNDESPNGLVQIEVSRKVSLLTGREQVQTKRGVYYLGALTYIRPRFSLNKIEEDNRYYILDSFAVNKERSFLDSQNHFNLNPLEVLRYQQWSIGLDLNIFSVYAINKKVNFQLSGSADYARTPVADSLRISNSKINVLTSRNISKVNSTTLGLSLAFEIKPDSRYGFSIGQDMKMQKVFDNRFEIDPAFNAWYATSWINAFFKTNKDSGSSIFFRFRKNWIYDNPRFNFYQVQLGYELNLFKTSN